MHVVHRLGARHRECVGGSQVGCEFADESDPGESSGWIGLALEGCVDLEIDVLGGGDFDDAGGSSGAGSLVDLDDRSRIAIRSAHSIGASIGNAVHFPVVQLVLNVTGKRLCRRAASALFSFWTSRS